jgi:hypothetical protein
MKQTQAFAPLHKLFAKIKVDSPDSGTSEWTEIFLLYPVTGASIATHKILALGLKTCLGFKEIRLHGCCHCLHRLRQRLCFSAKPRAAHDGTGRLRPRHSHGPLPLLSLREVELLLSVPTGATPATRRFTKSFSPTLTTATPSRSTRCNTRSSGFALEFIPSVAFIQPRRQPSSHLFFNG